MLSISGPEKLSVLLIAGALDLWYDETMALLTEMHCSVQFINTLLIPEECNQLGFFKDSLSMVAAVGRKNLLSRSMLMQTGRRL